MKIQSDNEWDALNSIVVGSAKRARFPVEDPIFNKHMEVSAWHDVPLPGFDIDEGVLLQTENDLIKLADTLELVHGIKVYRPKDMSFDVMCSTTNWTTDGMYNYCPRDLLLVIGDTVVETPMAFRARQFETEAYDWIRNDAFRDGANWIAAPRPTLHKDDVEIFEGRIQLTEAYPIFDAANVCRLGKDLLYLVSSTGNRRGAEWLYKNFPDRNVYLLENVYAHAHIDSTICPIAADTVILNASRINEQNCPDVFDGWTKIYITEDMIVKTPFSKYPYASAWIAMNMLAIAPKHVIMETGQPYIKRELEKHNVQVIELDLTGSRTMGGGFHCVTLDLHRGG